MKPIAALLLAVALAVAPMAVSAAHDRAWAEGDVFRPADWNAFTARLGCPEVRASGGERFQSLLDRLLVCLVTRASPEDAQLIGLILRYAGVRR